MLIIYELWQNVINICIVHPNRRCTNVHYARRLRVCHWCIHLLRPSCGRCLQMSAAMLPYSLRLHHHTNSAVTTLLQDSFYRAYNITPEEQNKNYVFLNIFYSSLSYNDVRVNAAYNFMALLSDIGGALGLLLGASLLTVYEIGEFACELMVDAVKSRKKMTVRLQSEFYCNAN